MAESRDRLHREFDIAAAFAQRHRSGSFRVFVDPPRQVSAFDWSGSPVAVAAARQRTPMGLLGFGSTGVVGGRGLPRSSLRTPMAGNGRGRISHGSATPSRENRTPAAAGSTLRRRGRACNSTLPSWYPRAPLQDITAVTRAMERRRARLAERDGESTEGQVPRDQNVFDQVVPVSGPLLEPDVPVTPYSAVRTKKCVPPSVGKVSKILRDVTNQNTEGEFLTPQKKLLNSIDKVEKVVREELQRLRRTPSAKKAERERRVRTLMSMR